MTEMASASGGKKKISLTMKIFIAMILGSIAGFIIGKPAMQIQFIGTMWLNMIKMIMVPTVMTMVITGISGMDNPKTLGRISLIIVIFYVFTTICATLLGMAVAEIFQPGIGFQFTESAEPAKVAKIMSLGDFLVGLISSNMFNSFAKANMMQILFIAIILGVGIVMIPKQETRVYLHNLFSKLSELCLSVINLSMLKI